MPSHLQRAEEQLAAIRSSKLNAFLSTAEKPLYSGGARGPLQNVTFGIKDVIAVKGLPMTCASKVMENFVAPYTATAGERLLAAGAVVLGKNNCDEFAAGSSGENSAFGATRNPLHPDWVPGGSSSGSAAAVAAGLCDAGLGSDTGGSIRLPASFCGLAALKPSYGLVSRFGLSDLSMSLEGPAPIARDVETVAATLDAIAGPDERDLVTATSSSLQTRKRLGDFSFKGKTIGLVKEHFSALDKATEKAVLAAIECAKSLGAKLKRFSLSSEKLVLPCYYTINYAEFASAMQRFDGLTYGVRKSGGSLAELVKGSRSLLGAEVKRRILLGSFITSREHKQKLYLRALKAKQLIAEDYTRILKKCDFLFSPTTPFTPFRFGERSRDPLALYQADVLTVSHSLTGNPAGVVPVNRKPPVGLQIIGKRFEDERVLQAMKAVEVLQ